MNYKILDEQIAGLIDQYKNEADEAIENANITDDSISSCLFNLVSKNMVILNNIRTAVSDYLEKNN